MTDRLKKYSVSIIAVLLIVILIALPTGYEDAVIYQGTDKVKAKVLSTDESAASSSRGNSTARWSFWKESSRETRPGR